MLKNAKFKMLDDTWCTWLDLMVLDDVWWHTALDGTWKFEVFIIGEIQWSNILSLFLISTLALHSMSIASPKLNLQLLTNPWDILSGKANNPPPKKESKSKFNMKLCSTMSLLLDWLILLLILISQSSFNNMFLIKSHCHLADWIMTIWARNIKCLVWRGI